MGMKEMWVKLMGKEEMRVIRDEDQLGSTVSSRRQGGQSSSTSGMKAITPTQREALGKLMDGGLGFVGDSTVRWIDSGEGWESK